MIEHPQIRRQVQEQRSQVALEVVLILWAIASTMILARTILILMHINDRIWIGQFVYGMTRPVAQFLDSIPGLSRIIVGPLSLTDMVLLAVVILFPLGLLATSTRGT